MSRLSIEIDLEQHRQIKMLATFAGMSIKDYILSKTLSKESRSADTTEYLMESSQNARRLKKSIAAPKGDHVAFESLEDLRNALGI
ncbi:hypothetical protein BH11VER1_BH11VER1_38770 [soil metagenome]